MKTPPLRPLSTAEKDTASRLWKKATDYYISTLLNCPRCKTGRMTAVNLHVYKKGKTDKKKRVCTHVARLFKCENKACRRFHATSSYRLTSKGFDRED